MKPVALLSLVLILALLPPGAPAARGQNAPAPEPAPEPAAEPAATGAAEKPALRDGDRILFLGDDLTQQMFYPRAAATCLLALHPGHGLRLYNGGRDGSTVAEAIDWSQPLIERVDPTVVVVCFGLNDLVIHDADQYELELSNLVAQIRRRSRVRRVIVMSPPALPEETGPKPAAFADAARAVAQTEKALFVDIHGPMRRLYDDADGDLQKELALGGRLPAEPMHVVIASHLLAGLGVTGEGAVSASWSPLTPVRMGRVRPHLAWADTEAPGSAGATASRRLYLTLAACDELFFRIWRLEPAGEEGALADQWRAAWSRAAAQAAGFAGPAAP